MDNVKQSQAFLRKRKMMLVLPVLVIPFMTLSFWALGGGKGNAANQLSNQPVSGLNLHLPDPKLKKETLLDKLSFYDKADKDSMKLREAMRNDPYYQQQLQEQNRSFNELEQIVQHSAGKFNQSSVTGEGKMNTSPYNTSANQAEEKLMQKLAELNKAISQPETKSVKTDDYSYSTNGLERNPELNSNVDRLENMMQSLNQPGDSDPELDKLSDMMDKILDIQHPERIKDQIKEKPLRQKADVFTISNKSLGDTIANGFYSLDTETEAIKSNAITAIVNENQVLVSGSAIKLRLTSDAYIKEVKKPAGSFVFGIASLDGERLNIEINSIRINNSLYPVKLEVYDMDGLPGIYIPGAINRDVAKQSADHSLQTMQLTSLDPSIAAQATAAGISTVKNLLSKKVKLVKVMVKSGYKVLLKDKSVQQ